MKGEKKVVVLTHWKIKSGVPTWVFSCGKAHCTKTQLGILEDHKREVHKEKRIPSTSMGGIGIKGTGINGKEKGKKHCGAHKF